MLRLFLLLVVTLTCPSLQAASIAHTIDTERTTIKLSWRAFGGIPSWAHLKGVTGKVILNPENEFDDHINVTVPVATLQASNNLLTWQLKSDMFFDAARYPTITFSSTRVVKLGPDHYRAFGTLTVRDLNRPVILDAGSIACRERRSPCMPLPRSHDRPIRWIVLRWWWTIASP